MKNDKQPMTEEIMLMTQMRQTDRLHRAAIETAAESMNIHRSQNLILMYLYHTEKVPTQRDIAEMFEVTPSAIAVGLRKLEEQGFITRTPKMDDIRSNEVRLTAKGKAKVEETERFFEEVDKAMFRGMSPEELQQLTGFFARMQENLKEAYPNVAPEKAFIRRARRKRK